MAFGLPYLTTRMYTSLAGLVEGWSKNVYVGGRRSFPDEPVWRALIPVMFSLGALFWLLPPAALGLALAGVAPALLTAALLAVGLSWLFWIVFFAGFGVNPIYACTYPLGVVMTGMDLCPIDPSRRAAYRVARPDLLSGLSRLVAPPEAPGNLSPTTFIGDAMRLTITADMLAALERAQDRPDWLIAEVTRMRAAGHRTNSRWPPSRAPRSRSSAP